MQKEKHSTKASTKAKDKYNKKTYERIYIRIRKDDLKTIQKLNEVANKNAYVVGLIHKDIAENEK